MGMTEIIVALHEALFKWYDFTEEAEIYTFDRTTVYEQIGKKFDYIIAKEDLETYENPQEFFDICKSLLRKKGRLLLAVNNRFGIRYFCGNKDLYTDRCFDGVEGYVRVYIEEKQPFAGRTYTRAELKQMLTKAGFSKQQFFSVFSDLENPVLIYREDFLPNEDVMARISPCYSDSGTVFLEEELLYKSLIENNMFHSMANAYIIECAFDTDVILSDVQHVTSSVERSQESAMMTIIHDSGIVEKCPVYREGQNRLKTLYENGERLKQIGVKMVPATYLNERYCMPFMSLENGHVYLKRLLENDPEQFLAALDLFRDTILSSSKIIKEDKLDGEGAILEYGYFDLVPLNSFFDGKEFVFYDQEIRIANFPANVLILRMITTLYYHDIRMEKWMPMEILLERYHLDTHLEKWWKQEKALLGELRNDSLLEEYHKKIRADHYLLQNNCDRLNYSTEYYRFTYKDIFANLENKKIILFGSGTYAERFWRYFGAQYPIVGVVDNQKEKWGTTWHGIEIYSPEWLEKIPQDEYKVMICMLHYKDVIEQLEKMNIKGYSVFDIQRLSGLIENIKER